MAPGTDGAPRKKPSKRAKLAKEEPEPASPAPSPKMPPAASQAPPHRQPTTAVELANLRSQHKPLMDRWSKEMPLPPSFLSSSFSENFSVNQATYLRHRAKMQVERAQEWIEETKKFDAFSIQVTSQGLQLVPKGQGPDDFEDELAGLDNQETDRKRLLRQVLADLRDLNGQVCPTFEDLAELIQDYLASKPDSTYTDVANMVSANYAEHLAAQHPLTLMRLNLDQFLRTRKTDRNGNRVRDGDVVAPFLETLPFKSLGRHISCTARYQAADKESRDEFDSNVRIAKIAGQEGNYDTYLHILEHLERNLRWEIPEVVVKMALLHTEHLEEAFYTLWADYGPHPWKKEVPGWKPE